MGKDAMGRPMTGNLGGGQMNDRPSVEYRPRLFIDGDQWCALYGDNLQDGVAGFGASPDMAVADFDVNWRRQLSQSLGFIVAVRFDSYEQLGRISALARPGETLGATVKRLVLAGEFFGEEI